MCNYHRMLFLTPYDKIANKMRQICELEYVPSFGTRIVHLYKNIPVFLSKNLSLEPLFPGQSCAIISDNDEIKEQRMRTETLHIESDELRRLFGAASGDAAMLYLYIRCGNDPKGAQADLQMPTSRYECAAAALRQLGLWVEEKRLSIATGERPNYSERDVMDSMDRDASFRALYGEVQRRLGKTLNTEELKILLGFVRYLGLSTQITSVSISIIPVRRSLVHIVSSVRKRSASSCLAFSRFWG